MTTLAVDQEPAAALRSRFNRRSATLIVTAIALLIVFAVVAISPIIGEAGIRSNFAERMQAPEIGHLFGTDFMGRDMLARTIHGLALSLHVGLIAALLSAIVAVAFALLAAIGGRAGDMVVSFLVDATMGLPHMVLLILVAFALGGGTTAVIIAVGVTHWPRLTRILRAEMLQIRDSEYVKTSRRFGKSWLYIGYRHMLPHLVPQLLVGVILMFPHAIMHEAGLTFLGFGLEPSRPAIGILLAESMRYLTAGYWWLGLFPGVCLLALVLCFDVIGNGLRLLTDPHSAQE